MNFFFSQINLNLVLDIVAEAGRHREAVAHILDHRQEADPDLVPAVRPAAHHLHRGLVHHPFPDVTVRLASWIEEESPGRQA